MRKSKYLLLIAISTLSIANNRIQTDNSVDVKASKSKTIFGYSTVTNLEIKPVDYLNIELGLFSKRYNIHQSDLLDDDIEKSHDLGIKVGLNYDYTLDNLNFKTSIKQYLPHFFEQELKKDGKYKFEYIDGDSKQALGNTLISSSIKGTHSGYDLDMSAEYKGNTLYRHDIDESYLKTNLSVSKKINDNLKLSGKYTFDIDLDLMTRPYKPLVIEEDNVIPETMVNSYITQTNNNLELSLENTLSEINKLNFDFIVKNINNSAKESTNTKYVINDNKAKLNLDTTVTTNVLKGIHNLELKNTLFNGVVINSEDIKSENYAPSSHKVSYGYEPKIKSNLKYGYEKDSLNTEVETSLMYGTLFVVNDQEVVTPENMVHSFEYILNNSTKYKIDEKQDLDLSLKNKVTSDVKFTERIKSKTNISSNLDFKYNFKLNDNFNLKYALSNNLLVKTKKISYQLDTMSEKFSSKLNTETILLKDNKHKLVLENGLEYSHDSNYIFEYRVRKKLNSLEENYSVIANQRESLNKIKLDNKLEHTYEISDKLTLNSNLLANFELDTLMVKEDRVSDRTYKLDDDKESLKISDEYTRKTNIGGKIEIEPSVKLEYRPINNFSVTSKLSSMILFEKDILEKVDDKYRADNGLYMQADKEFGFKKIIPKVDLGIKYEW